MRDILFSILMRSRLAYSLIFIFTTDEDILEADFASTPEMYGMITMFLVRI